MTVALRPARTDEPDVDDLASRIIGMAGRLAAATCRWLLLVAAFDACEGHARYGLPTTGRWLSHYCGLSRRTARDHVRVARTLAAHSGLADAMAAGRLSYSHVRAISRVAELGDHHLVDDLIMVAEYGTAGQLEDMVRGLRTIDDNNRDADQRVPERFSRRWRADSFWGMSAKLEPQHGALVQSAVEAIAAREGITQPAALTRMAEIALAALSASEAGMPTLRGDEQAAVVIHVNATPATASAEALGAEPAEPDEPDAAAEAAEAELAGLARVGDTIAEDGRAAMSAQRERGSAEPRRPAPYGRIAGGPGLSAAVVERLACSSRVRLLVFDPRREPGEGPTPLDAGRLRRLVSQKQFRALLARDDGCAHPGCGSSIGLEAHHVLPWLHGGKTDMANLILLCRRHHHRMHDGEFRIVALGRGRFRFLRPDGQDLPRHVDPSGYATSSTPLEDEHAGVADCASTTRWDGGRLDHDYALAGLAQGLTSSKRRRAADRERRAAAPGFDPWNTPTGDAA